MFEANRSRNRRSRQTREHRREIRIRRRTRILRASRSRGGFSRLRGNVFFFAGTRGAPSAPQQRADEPDADFRQPVHDAVRARAPKQIGGIRRGDGDDFEAAGDARLDAGERILEDDDVFRREPERLRRLQKNVRRRLARGDAFLGNDAGKIGMQIHDFEREVDVRALGRRADGAGNVLLLQVFQQTARAGQRLEAVFADDFPENFLLAFGKRANFFRIAAPAENVRDDFFVPAAEAEPEMVFREKEVFLCGENFPAAFVRGGRIDDDAVPIEDGSGGEIFSHGEARSGNEAENEMRAARGNAGDGNEYRTLRAACKPPFCRARRAMFFCCQACGRRLI